MFSFPSSNRKVCLPIHLLVRRDTRSAGGQPVRPASTTAAPQPDPDLPYDEGWAGLLDPDVEGLVAALPSPTPCEPDLQPLGLEPTLGSEPPRPSGWTELRLRR